MLGQLGSKAAWVVHGLDGLDEITLTAKTKVSALGRRGRAFYIDPVALGLDPCEPKDLLGGTAAENAAVLRDVLGGARGRSATWCSSMPRRCSWWRVRRGPQGGAREGREKRGFEGRAQKLDGLVKMTAGKVPSKG